MYPAAVIMSQILTRIFKLVLHNLLIIYLSNRTLITTVCIYSSDKIYSNVKLEGDDCNTICTMTEEVSCGTMFYSNYVTLSSRFLSFQSCYKISQLGNLRVLNKLLFILVTLRSPQHVQIPNNTLQ